LTSSHLTEGVILRAEVFDLLSKSFILHAETDLIVTDLADEKVQLQQNVLENREIRMRKGYSLLTRQPLGKNEFKSYIIPRGPQSSTAARIE